MNRKSASVYHGKDAFYVHSNAQTKAGFWIAHGFFKVLPIAEPLDAVVSACREALSNSVHGVATPTDFKLLSATTVVAFGLKNRTVLDRQSILCELDLDDSRVRIMPTKKDGKRNFLHLPSEAIEFEWDAPMEVFSEALMTNLKKCS
ncbi:MAG: hypothetical protein QM724_04910 [Flavobacteriales bacterium]